MKYLYGLEFEQPPFEQFEVTPIVSPKTFILNDGTEVFDILITDLNMTGRLSNRLRSMDIFYVSDLMQVSIEDLESLNSVGLKTLQEFKDLKNNIVFTEVPNYKGKDEIVAYCKEICDFYPISVGKLYNELYPALENSTFPLSTLELSSLLQKQEIIKNLTKITICEGLKSNLDGFPQQNLLAFIPNVIAHESFLCQMIEELVAEEKVFFDNNVCKLVLPSALDYIKTIENKSYKKCALLRMQGLLLEEVGEQLGVSRERVRQIMNAVWSKSPILEEDRYAAFYQHYKVEKDTLMSIYNVPESTYFYLKSRYKKGKHFYC